jgi:PTH1 family peptidyl-tRNA hydrolase
MPEKYLLVGLGNPGREYRLNRHNVGFMLLDHLVERHRLLGFTKRQSKALVTTGNIAGAAVILAKPQTFMNLSGEAVGALVRFYDLPLERLIVCYDDVDLPLGTLRLRPEGGSAGHNGMKSIIAHLGTQAFPRLRLGVDRPPGKKNAAVHVLGDLKGEALEIMELALDKAADAVETFIKDGVVLAMSRFNGPWAADDET